MQEVSVDKIIPLKNSVIVEPFAQEDKTEDGWELPEKASSATPVLGKVVKAGAESQFKEGDIVFFRRYSIDQLSFVVDGKPKEFNFLTDAEIVAYIRQ